MNRTRNAIKSAISQFVSRGASVLIGVLVTPMLVAQLGAESYGGWLMLIQVVAYATIADLGNATIVKFDLAASQHSSDHQAKNIQITSALLTALITSPIFIGVGWGILFIVTKFSPVGHVGGCLEAGLLLLFSYWLARFSSILIYVLFGVNQDYRSTVTRMAIAVAAAVCDVVVVGRGYGIIGLGLVKFVAALALLCSVFYAVCQHVPWFAFRMPVKKDFIFHFRRNVKYLLSQAGSVFAEGSDIAVVGILAGPTAASVYALTGALLRTVAGTFSSMLLASRPGFGDLFGRGDLERIGRIRNQMASLTHLICAGIGVGYLVLNVHFLKVWVGVSHYGGACLSLLILIYWCLLLVNRQEMSLLMVCLVVNKAAIIHFFYGAVGIVVAVLLGILFGIKGVVSGLCIGQVLEGRAYGAELARRFSLRLRSRACGWVSLAASMILGLVVGTMLGSEATLLMATIAAFCAVAVSILFSWRAAVLEEDRQDLLKRLKSVWAASQGYLGRS